MSTHISSAASRAWLTQPVVLLGEFQALDGVHLLRSDDGRLLARWYEGHATVELLDPATVNWPALPLAVPPNLRPTERPDPSRRSRDGTALAWLADNRFPADSELLDLGQARVLSSIGEGIKDWGPSHAKLGTSGQRESSRSPELSEWLENLRRLEKSEHPEREPPTDGWVVSSAMFSPDGMLLAIKRRDWTVGSVTHVHPIEIWQIAGSTPALVNTIGESSPDQTEWRNVVGFDPENRYLVVENSDKVWEAYDIASGCLDPDMSREIRARLHLVIDDDRLVAVGDVEADDLLDAPTPREATLRRKALEQKQRSVPVELKELAKSSLLRQRVSEMPQAWSTDRSLVATHEVRSVEIWSVESGELTGHIELTASRHHYSGEPICFSHDNRSLLVSGEYVVAGVWDWAAGRHLWSPARVDRPHPPPDTPKILSPDGRLVVSSIFGANGFTVSSVETGQVLIENRIPSFNINTRGVAFSPDGSYLAVLEDRSDRRIVKIWAPRSSGSSSLRSRKTHPEAMAMPEAITIGQGCDKPEVVDAETPASAMQ